MDKQYQAIETIYNGYRFRSRLEARWAVFFDTMGIPWEYEPEGFVMSDGTCYLPDFYLPEADEFFECNGVMGGKDLHKIEQFMKESGKPVVIGYNGMKFKSPVLWGEDPPVLDRSEPNWQDHFGRCRHCGHLFFMNDFGAWDCPSCKKRVGKSSEDWISLGEGSGNDVRWPYWYDGDRTELERYTRAKDAAKQARFEHGETGIPKKQVSEKAPPKIGYSNGPCLICGSTANSKVCQVQDPDPKWKDKPVILCETCRNKWVEAVQKTVDMIEYNREAFFSEINANTPPDEIWPLSVILRDKNTETAADLLSDIIQGRSLKVGMAWQHLHRVFAESVRKHLPDIGNDLRWPANMHPPENFRYLANKTGEKRKAKYYHF